MPAAGANRYGIREGIARLFAGLPAMIVSWWTQHINGILFLTGHQHLSIHLSSIDFMKRGEAITLSKTGMNVWEGMRIRVSSCLRRHLRHHRWARFITRFCTMGLVANPKCAALVSSTGIHIIR